MRGIQEIFFNTKRGDSLSLGSSQDKGSLKRPLVNPPGFSSAHKGTSMQSLPKYKDVPFFQEKLQGLKLLIKCQESTAALWESKDPTYDLLPGLKGDLARNKKMLADVTGSQPCL